MAVKYNTPHPPKGENVDTMVFPTKNAPAGSKYQGTSKASYTPSAVIDPHSYGVSTGKANAQSGSVPSTQVGGGSEVGSLPHAFDGNFQVGDNKNVSTPVSGS